MLGFYGTAADGEGRAAIDAILAERARFDDLRTTFFGVSVDPSDAAERIAEQLPGIRHFLDFDGVASRLYGALPTGGAVEPSSFRRFCAVLGPQMRCLKIFPIAGTRDSSPTSQICRRRIAGSASNCRRRCSLCRTSSSRRSAGA